jgi:Bacterial regulatory protein, Fis family/Sigma-54 interaction domain
VENSDRLYTMGVMQSRRSRTRVLPKGSDLVLLEVAADRTRPHHLSSNRTLVFAGRDGWEVRIIATPDAIVDVHASGGAAVRVNDVQVRSVARARAGDLISLPDRSLVVQRFSTHIEASPLLANHEAFERRLIGELGQAVPAKVPISILVVRSRALLGDGLREFLETPEMKALAQTVVIGHLAPATLELLCPRGSTVESDQLREHLSETLGRLGRPFRWGWASAPTDGLSAVTLWGRVMDRLFAERVEPADELPYADPVMVRLSSLCDAWAGMKGGVFVQGEVGSGRETLARVIHERASSQAPYVVFRSGAFDSSLWRANVERAHGGTLYVRHPAALPSSELASFWDATSFRPMAGGKLDERATAPVVIALPALRDRPLDVLPIADHVLARCPGFEGSRKLRLTAAARSVLSKDWTGSVRELKSLLQRAALLGDASGEVLPEYLTGGEGRFAAGGSKESDLRASLRTMESRAFLEALGRTSWNVTEAARELGLPRRTVVYRMAKLGLKRPGQEG